jgi:hypothetical protein
MQTLASPIRTVAPVAKRPARVPGFKERVLLHGATR